MALGATPIAIGKTLCTIITKEYMEEISNIESFSDNELKSIADELNIKNYDAFSRADLIKNIKDRLNKSPFESAFHDIAEIVPTLSPSMNIIFDFWFRAFKKNKLLTSALTIVFCASLTIAIYHVEKKDAVKREKIKNENFDLAKRIEELENIQNGLNELIEFVVNQKNAIIQTELNIKELEKQKNDLEPIVLSQKETVEAIFQEQEKRDYKNRWIERFIGFGLGIVASIIASIIYGLIKRKIIPNKPIAAMRD